MITIEKKKEITEELKKGVSNSKSLFLADFKNLKVEEINDFRKMCREENVRYKVVKNTLLKRIFSDEDIDGLSEFCVGPTAIAFSEEDEVSPARVLKEFLKKYKHRKDDFSFKIGYLDNKTVEKSEIGRLADLPPKEVLISMLAGTLKAPIGKFAMVLKANISKAVYALNAVKEKKEASGD